MEGADLSEASLDGVHFDEARMRRVQLRSSSGQGLSFINADLREVDLSEVRFSHPHFMMTDLSEANLKDASVEGGDFTEASLKYADLSGADFSDANLEGADLRGAIFLNTKLDRASLYRTVPEKPDFTGALNVPSSTPRTVFGLASGGGTGTGEFDPPYDERTAVRIKVYYATDRIPDARADRRHFYGTQDSDTVSFGTCEVSIPKDRRIGEIPRPSLWRLEFRENLSKHVVLLKADEMDRDDFFASIHGSISKSPSQPRAFLFVHGYKVSFEDAARRTAQLAHDLSFEGVPMFYSWASRASIKDYPADLSSNMRTWHRLAAFLSELSARGRFETIHIISHSMGGRAICQSAVQMLAQQPQAMLSFKNVIFAAPDVEVPVFRNALSSLASLASRITLYFSPNDVALSLSQRFHRSPRTGGTAVVAKGLDTIDASAVIGDILGHSALGERSVIGDIYELLKEDRSPGHRFGMELIHGPDGDYFKFRP
jgi:esterase/lipase superfamily enzyme